MAEKIKVTIIKTGMKKLRIDFPIENFCTSEIPTIHNTIAQITNISCKIIKEKSREFANNPAFAKFPPDLNNSFPCMAIRSIKKINIIL